MLECFDGELDSEWSLEFEPEEAADVLLALDFDWLGSEKWTEYFPPRNGAGLVLKFLSKLRLERVGEIGLLFENAKELD